MSGTPDPTAAIHKAPQTFDTRIDAEAWAAAVRRQIDTDRWRHRAANGTHHLRRLRGPLAGIGKLSGRPIKARTRAHYQAILDQHLLEAFGARQLGAITPKDVRDWHEATLVDRPTLRSHAYSLLRTILASRGQRRTDRRQPGPYRRRRPGQAGAPDPAGQSVAELGVLTEAMPERLRLMVTLASLVRVAVR